MPLISKAEAAKLAGVSRTTFYRHIKNGLVSTSYTANGKQKIDTSELLRVYGELQIEDLNNTKETKKTKKTKKSVTIKPVTSDANNTRNELYELKLDMLTQKLAAQEELAEQMLSDKREQLADLRQKNEEAKRTYDKLLDIIAQNNQIIALQHEKKPSFLRGLFKPRNR